VSRWFRSYADTHRNPKIARLSDKDFRLWHRLLCIAAENGGTIPPADDLKHMLSMRLDHCSEALRRFQNGGLLDPVEGGYVPHNWNQRQYKSDTSTERVRKFRTKGNVAGNVSETAPDTDTESDTLANANGAAAAAADPEKIMFDSGLAMLQAQGVPERKGRPWLGKLKRDYGAPDVISALSAAKREGAIELISFVEAALKTRARTHDPPRLGALC
jgi:hypothetical protein